MVTTEQNNSKERTLRTLRIIRFLQICGAFVTSVATMAIIIADAFVWLRSPENWWSGVAYCFLALQLMGLYAWGTICLIDNADWNIKRKDWLAVILGFTLLIGFLSSFPLQFILIHTETQCLPLINSFVAIIMFVGSLFFFGFANETSLDIRKKLDPNFKVCRGFS